MTMTVGQRWKTVFKGFTLGEQELSVESKEQLFEKQREQDNSDTAKNYRLACDALKADKEEFEEIYQRLKDKTLSITAKEFLASGWNN